MILSIIVVLGGFVKACAGFAPALPRRAQKIADAAKKAYAHGEFCGIIDAILIDTGG